MRSLKYIEGVKHRLWLPKNKVKVVTELNSVQKLNKIGNNEELRARIMTEYGKFRIKEEKGCDNGKLFMNKT